MDHWVNYPCPQWDLVDYMGPQIEHLTTTLNAQIAWSQGLRETVDVMRTCCWQGAWPENPIVIEDDDEDEVEIRVGEEDSWYGSGG